MNSTLGKPVVAGMGCSPISVQVGGDPMITIRDPKSIFRIEGKIANGRFNSRWHFVFGNYYDPQFEDFGALCVFNDDTLTPGAVWPLHQHRNREIVTYVADGEFRHKDENGNYCVLMKGWVQHATVGRGMWHAEINNRSDRPMRLIQMWFYPEEYNLETFVEQKMVKKADRTDRFLPLVSNRKEDTLTIVSDARIFSGFLRSGKAVRYNIEAGRGVYLYVLEGGPIWINGSRVPALGAAMITGETTADVFPDHDAELLLVDVKK